MLLFTYISVVYILNFTMDIKQSIYIWLWTLATLLPGQLQAQETAHKTAKDTIENLSDSLLVDSMQEEVFDVLKQSKVEELWISIDQAIENLRKNDTVFHQLELALPYWDGEIISIFWHDDDIHVKDTGDTVWRNYKIASKDRILSLDEYVLSEERGSEMMIDTEVHKVIRWKKLYVPNKTIKLDKDILREILTGLVQNQFSDWLLRNRISVKSADGVIDLLLK